MTTLPNGLTMNTEVGKVALPTCSKTMSGASPRISLTRLANSRETAKRAFSSSGVSPPRRIMPANSLRSMKPLAPSCSTSSPFSAEETTPTHSAPAARAELGGEDAEAAGGAPDQHAVAGLQLARGR